MPLRRLRSASPVANIPVTRVTHVASILITYLIPYAQSGIDESQPQAATRNGTLDGLELIGQWFVSG